MLRRLQSLFPAVATCRVRQLAASSRTKACLLVECSPIGLRTVGT